VFEALCYSLKGEVPKLVELPSSERATEYYKNRFHSLEQATIVLTLTPDDGQAAEVVQVQLNADGARTVHSPSGHTDPEALLESLNNDLVLLDNREFLRFVEDTPLARGRALSSLLGLSKLSELRQVLEVLSNARNLATDFSLSTLEESVASTRRSADSHLQSAVASYEDVVGGVPQDSLDFEAMAKRICTALVGIPVLSEHFSSGDLGSVDFEAIRASIKLEEKGDLRTRLSEIVTALSELKKLSPHVNQRKEQDSLRGLLHKYQAAIKNTQGPLFEKLFEIVRQVLESPDWDNDLQCPACESDLEHPLLQEIQQKLGSYKKASETQQQIRDLWKVSSWAERLESRETSTHLQIAVGDRSYRAIDEKFRLAEPSELDLDDAIARLDELETLRSSKMTELESERLVLEKKLPPSLVTLSEQVAHAEQFRKSWKSYQETISQLEQTSAKLDQRRRWADFIKRASEDFAEAEVSLSSAQISSLETQYQQMYASVTKNPNIVPKLKKAIGSEDLHLRLENFYGLTDVSAATLLAESYRNAFAMSIYLSAALNQKSSARFLVLDDVTSSFDSGHQYQLMELLRTQVGLPQNSDGLQVIVLSHDGLLEKYFDKLSNTREWHHQRLQGLSPKGALITQAQQADRLKLGAERFLNAGQVEQAIPLIRQYLEFKLLQVIRKVDIPVPMDFSIRDDRQMVQNSLDAITRAIEVENRAGSLVLDPAQHSALDQTLVPTLVANWLSHYPTGVAASLTPYVLQGVLDTVDQIADCFRYHCTCSGTSQKRFYRSLSTKHCQC
jgi:hypothetical protein